ncbi:MAG: BMP family ABC transporter substrate-binding protein [Clostridiales bacterium]|jgi:basic membrane protein A|nr:BMP family ABC transporter substrate-binding protein [Clostridiales bacterium]
MKKFLSLGLAAALIFSLASCSGQSAASTEGANAPANETETYELALVTDLGTIDDKSFNQGAWEGMAQYAEENNIPHKYYQPSEQSDDSYLNTIELAVKGGAKLIITPGFLFETPVFIAQDTYPDVAFVLIDGSPHSADYSEYKTGPKTVGVTYAEEEAGFLAGYAAVKDGHTQLGYMGGMAVPAVMRYGYGFIQGADYAAKELSLAAGSVSIQYHYTGAFVASPEAQAMAASWYNAGTEIIFAAGGAVGNSVMAAAEQAGKKVIGVDVDQSSESPTVVTSALKGLRSSVYDCVKGFYDGSFAGGQDLVFAAENSGVGLAMDTAKFEKFTLADYDAIYAKLVSKSVDIVRDVDATGATVEIANVPVAIAVVNEIK